MALPQEGLRLDVRRADNEEATRVTYRGQVTVSDVVTDVSVVAEANGVTVEIVGPPAEWAGQKLDDVKKTIAALVRAATRIELEEGAPVPRRITRWRALTSK